jgi:hypothetical protein
MNSVGDRSEVVREAGARRSFSQHLVQLHSQRRSLVCSAFGTNEGAVGLRALGVKELNYRMNFLANNVTVQGLSDAAEVDAAPLTQSEQDEIRRMMSRRNLYQVSRASFT